MSYQTIDIFHRKAVSTHPSGFKLGLQAEARERWIHCLHKLITTSNRYEDSDDEAPVDDDDEDEEDEEDEEDPEEGDAEPEGV